MRLFFGKWMRRSKDESLESFSMEREEQYVVPLIEDCFSIVTTHKKRTYAHALTRSPPHG